LRAPTSAAFRLPDSNVIVMSERPTRETDITVEAVDETIERFTAAGNQLINRPFEIAIGRCAVVADPWDNLLVLLENSKGFLATDDTGTVHRCRAPATGGRAGRPGNPLAVS
jgi:hypothetical protein